MSLVQQSYVNMNPGDFLTTVAQSRILVPCCFYGFYGSSLIWSKKGILGKYTTAVLGKKLQKLKVFKTFVCMSFVCFVSVVFFLFFHSFIYLFFFCSHAVQRRGGSSHLDPPSPDWIGGAVRRLVDCLPPRPKTPTPESFWYPGSKRRRIWCRVQGGWEVRTKRGPEQKVFLGCNMGSLTVAAPYSF